MSEYKRKLIEVALPLDAINRESACEKSIRHGHPSTLHMWWARRPLAACRAVLFAQLVDDPSSHPDRFPSEEDQKRERRRLFDLMERLVLWENVGDERLFRAAHAEIAACFAGKPPSVLDPFAGGGSIPLEAQRLGLEARASDLNPVPVLINKALIEVPPRWIEHPPVFPGSAAARMGTWPRATGLAEDVRRYGSWIRDEAVKRLKKQYPIASLSDGSEANVIAWLWARTVACPNPGCGALMPLISSLWLAKRKGHIAWLNPVVEGNRVTFEIKHGPDGPPDPPKQGRGAKFACLVCGGSTQDAYIKAEGMARRMGQQLIAVVADAPGRRVYLPATEEHIAAAAVERPDDVPEAELANDPRNIWCVSYGLTTFADLFSTRQLQTLTTLADLVNEVRAVIHSDAAKAHLSDQDASAYARDVCLYLGLCASKMAMFHCTLSRWRPDAGKTAPAFGRQAIAMVWDFAEVNPFAGAGGDWMGVVAGAAGVLDRNGGQTPALVTQESAPDREYGVSVISTDPPYYDNIGYADLSDFFYVWLRRTLGDSFPDLLATVVTPKTEELVATPYRFGGSRAAAEEHFESGFVSTFSRIAAATSGEVPITIFYAFKQAEDDDSGTASTGWETMLSGLIQAGLTVTATWPMRTEMGTRLIGANTNALASSIVLACRPKSDTAEAVNRRGFIAALQAELPRALRELQQGSVAPVDLAQAAIGPGMAVFTRYRTVVEADGSAMTVRTALALINQVLDEVLSEQEGDLNADSRFAVAWFGQHAWDEGDSGLADQLARAKNTSIEGLERGGIFRARAGKARLLGVDDLEPTWNPEHDGRISEWEVVVRVAKALAEGGIDEAAPLLAACGRRIDLDNTKELAYLLFALCEKRGWTQSAVLFNALGSSWADLLRAGRGTGTVTQAAMTFDDGDEE